MPGMVGRRCDTSFVRCRLKDPFPDGRLELGWRRSDPPIPSPPADASGGTSKWPRRSRAPRRASRSACSRPVPSRYRTRPTGRADMFYQLRTLPHSRSRVRCSASAACCSADFIAHEPHGGTRHRLADRLRVPSISLAALHIGLHVGWWHQPHVMAELCQLTRPTNLVEDLERAGRRPAWRRRAAASPRGSTNGSAGKNGSFSRSRLCQSAKRKERDRDRSDPALSARQLQG